MDQLVDVRSPIIRNWISWFVFQVFVYFEWILLQESFSLIQSVELLIWFIWMDRKSIELVCAAVVVVVTPSDKMSIKLFSSSFDWFDLIDRLFSCIILHCLNNKASFICHLLLVLVRARIFLPFSSIIPKVPVKFLSIKFQRHSHRLNTQWDILLMPNQPTNIHACVKCLHVCSIIF